MIEVGSHGGTKLSWEDHQRIFLALKGFNLEVNSIGQIIGVKQTTNNKTVGLGQGIEFFGGLVTAVSKEAAGAKTGDPGKWGLEENEIKSQD